MGSTFLYGKPLGRLDASPRGLAGGGSQRPNSLPLAASTMSGSGQGAHRGRAIFRVFWGGSGEEEGRGPSPPSWRVTNLGKRHPRAISIPR